MSSDQGWAKLPKFTGKNFQGWKRQVLVVMKNKGLIDHLMGTPPIKPEAPDGKEDGQADTIDLTIVNEKNETLTQGLLFSALDDKVMGQVQTCKTAADIWKRLLLIYENASETNVDRLLQEYYSYVKVAQEDMATHISKVESMADQLGSLGEPQSERSVVSKLLNSLPREYDAFRNAWDSTHPEFRTKDDLITRLMKQEVLTTQAPKNSGKDVAMFVKSNKSSKRKTSVKCYNCAIVGHLARDCRKPKKDGTHPSGQPTGSGSQNYHDKNRHSAAKGEFGLALTSSFVNLGLSIDRSGDKMFNRFIMDSGASRHVTPRREYLVNYRPCDLMMQAANNETIKAIGVGDVKLLCRVGTETTNVTLYDVLHIPDVSHNLFSVCQATKNGAKVIFYDWGCRVVMDDQVIAIGKTADDSPVPILQADTIIDRALAVQTKRPLADWHNSLGHADTRVIHEMATNKCVDGLEITHKEDNDCSVCPMGKGTRAPHTKESSFKPTFVGERVDFDLIGPLSEPSLSNSRYILLTKDKFSGYSHIYVMKTKDETCDKLTEFLSQFEHDSGHRVRAVQTDNGSEFVNENVRRLFAVEHVDFRTSAPYTPEQNGTAERNNRVIIETVRTLVAQSDLPPKLWAEAANTAMYLRNIIAKKGMNVTPFELFRGRRPFVGHIVPFGTRVHSLINDRRQGKFDSKTEPGIIVGFTPRMNTYRVYLPLRGTVKITCDVVFKSHHLFEKDYLRIDDLTLPGRSDDSVGVKLSADEPKSVDRRVTQPHLLSNFFNELYGEMKEEAQKEETCWHDAASCTGSEPESPAFSDITVRPSDEPRFRDNIVNITNRSNSLGEPPLLDSPRSERSWPSVDISSDPPALDSHGDSKDKNQDSIVSEPPVLLGQATVNTLLILAEETSMLDEPQTYHDAVTGPNSASWKQAIDSEKSAHEMNKTWKIVRRPDSGTTLTAKWIFKIKRDPEGRPKRFKARLVARGYKQKAGVDYVETFAPVAKMDSIRTLLAIAAARGYCIEQFDVSTAFLNGDIADDIYIEPPEGIATSNNECLKLQKALYGLKQAPRVWNSKFDEELKKRNFKPLKTDPCVYTSGQNDVYLGIYVDDGIIISHSREKCVDVISSLNRVFSVNRVTNSTFLGIDIIATRGGLFLSQKRYISDVLDRFKMNESKPKSAPMNDINPLFVKDSKVLVDIPYREAIGSILYCAMLTRPDLLYSTVLLSRFCTAPEQKHWTAVKDLLRYLKGTIELGLLYGKTQGVDFDVNVYSDSDWAGDGRDRKSTTGLIITLAGSPIIFASRQQPVVALSSTEAEFVASCEATKELMWLIGFLKELKIAHAQPILHVDNRSTIRLIKNNEMQRRTKHVDIKFHYVRDQYVDGHFELRPIDTEAQLADFLTKGLSGPRLATLLKMVNLSNRPP